MAARATAWLARRGEGWPRLVQAQRFVMHVGQRMISENIPSVAAALTYTSLLALVPLIAIAVAVLAAFPVFDDVRAQAQEFLFGNFLPDVGLAVQDHITRFVDQTAQLTAVGVGGLAVTALLMLWTIEQAFNEIFRVAHPRPLMARLLMYWTVLTLGPFLIGVSFSISGYLATAGRDVLSAERVEDVGTRLSWLLPYLLTLTAFGLLYMAVPNRRVAFRDALIGAVVAAALFAALRYGFLLFMSNVGTYQTVYGALAALPLFLLWMYLSWWVVLVGAVLTATLPEWRMRRGAQLAGGAGEARLALTLDILAALGRTHRFGRGLSRYRLMALTAAPEDTLVAALDQLTEVHVVTRSAEGDWMLARPLEAMTLNDVLALLGLALPGDPPTRTGGSWDERVHHALDRARCAQREALSLSLADLLRPRRRRTSWSPRVPSGPGMPLPGRRRVVPPLDPAGTVRRTLPSMVGTSILPPSTTSCSVTGTSATTREPSRRSRACGLTLTSTSASPSGPPDWPGPPWPFRRRVLPSSLPGGTLTFSRLPLVSDTMRAVPMAASSNVTCRR